MSVNVINIWIVEQNKRNKCERIKNEEAVRLSSPQGHKAAGGKVPAAFFTYLCFIDS